VRNVLAERARRRGTGSSGGVAAGVLVLFSPLSQLSYIPISVVLGAQIGLSPFEVGVTVGAHSLATAIGSLLFGPVLDLYPVRRILPLALAANALASLVLCLHPTYELLLGGRLVTGLTSAVIMLCAYVMVSDTARHEDTRRDRALSLMQTFQSVGAASALGLGALAASYGQPRLVFALLAVYGLAMLVVSLRSSLVRAAAPAGAGARRPDPVTVAKEIGGLVRQRRMLCLMLGSLALGVVIQGSHFGVSLLLDARADTISAAERVLLSVLIPCGVFTGSSVNRRLLRTFTRARIYRGLYLVLPVAVLLYAASTAYADQWVQALGLLLVGSVLGAMMPLSTALGVGWFPHLRGSATAAESLARGAGQTLGPVMVGALAAGWSSSLAAVGVAGVAAVGLVASLGISTRTTGAGRATPEAQAASEVELADAAVRLGRREP